MDLTIVWWLQLVPYPATAIALAVQVPVAYPAAHVHKRVDYRWAGDPRDGWDFWEDRSLRLAGGVRWHGAKVIIPLQLADLARSTRGSSNGPCSQTSLTTCQVTGRLDGLGKSHQTQS